jgi:hypothetical protein
MYQVGDDNVPLCLDCYEKAHRIHAVEFLKNAMMLNQALDDMDEMTGMISNRGRLPVHEFARAITGGHTLNNISITNSQVGVLNTGAIERIDAAITLSRGSDAAVVAEKLKSLIELVANSEELTDKEKNEVVELAETISEEIVGQRKPATIAAVMRSLKEKVSGSLAIAAAADELWKAIQTILGL